MRRKPLSHLKVDQTMAAAMPMQGMAPLPVNVNDTLTDGTHVNAVTAAAAGPPAAGADALAGGRGSGCISCCCLSTYFLW